MTGTPILELREVDASYGPFRALFGVSITLRAGRTLALLGPNGSGKTTVARVCGALLPPTAGSILLRGEDVSGLGAFELARRGVAHAPEGRSVFGSLTVEENLLLGLRSSTRHWQREDNCRPRPMSVKAALEVAYSSFPRLGERRNQMAGTLSGGEQRMLSLARVIADPPVVLIADELSLGLAPIVVDEVYATLSRIRDRGTAVIVVEQQIGHAIQLADDVVVLSQGTVTYDGSADDPMVRDHLMAGVGSGGPPADGGSQ